MNIELILSPALYAGRQTQLPHAAVAVDVLRATSSICAAFQAGVESIVPLDTLEAVPSYRDNGYLVAAERFGKKLLDATCGNSPTEYLAMDLSGKRLAYSSTNGTVSILTAADADPLYVGAFANISALADKLHDVANVVVLCSGWLSDPSLEDTLFAGALIDKLLSAGHEVRMVNDAANMALDLWHIAQRDPLYYCAKASHVRRLRDLGCEADLRWCFQPDTLSVVPRYVDRRLIID